jgi:hypothetical protein
MFGSQVLEVAVGLVLMYLLLSLVCSSIREGLEAWLKSRAADLERGIRELLNDPKAEGLARALYTHPLVFGLFRDGYNPKPKISETLPRGGNLPSYIPAGNFAVALMDIVARGPGGAAREVGASTVAKSAPADDTRISIGSLRAAAAGIQNEAVKRALLAAIDTAQGDLGRAQANLEAWFNSGMDRVSGWYKRRTQNVLFVVGVVLVIAVNADTLTIAQSLIHDGDRRKAIVTQAEAIARDDKRSPADVDAAVDKLQTRLESIGFPVGWAPQIEQAQRQLGAKSCALECVWIVIRNSYVHIPGWLLTAFAITLGAPFWFDLLNKFMVIRSTVKPREKSREEASEDRQTRGADRGRGAGAAATDSSTAAAHEWARGTP